MCIAKETEFAWSNLQKFVPSYNITAFFTPCIDQQKIRQIRFYSNSKTKAVQNLRNKNKPLPYTRTSGLLLHALVDIRLKKDNFGLHSLRLGGATLTSNKGVIKRQARWKSKNAKD